MIEYELGTNIATTPGTRLRMALNRSGDILVGLLDLLKAFWVEILIGTVVLGIVTTLILLLIPHDVNLTIKSFSWQRSVRIDGYRLVREEDWDIPQGGTYVSERQAVRSTTYDYWYSTSEPKTSCTTTYYDCGESECSKESCTTTMERHDVYHWVDHYDTLYTYDIWKWIPVREVNTGAWDRKPFWGEVKLAADERENSRAETYYFVGTDDKGKDYTVVVPYKAWTTLETGGKVTVSRNGFDHVEWKDNT